MDGLSGPSTAFVRNSARLEPVRCGEDLRRHRWRVPLLFVGDPSVTDTVVADQCDGGHFARDCVADKPIVIGVTRLDKNPGGPGRRPGMMTVR